jgi:hypothetical protein
LQALRLQARIAPSGVRDPDRPCAGLLLTLLTALTLLALLLALLALLTGLTGLLRPVLLLLLLLLAVFVFAFAAGVLARTVLLSHFRFSVRYLVSVPCKRERL